jgi:hypothetical protein
MPDPVHRESSLVRLPGWDVGAGWRRVPGERRYVGLDEGEFGRHRDGLTHSSTRSHHRTPSQSLPESASPAAKSQSAFGVTHRNVKQRRSSLAFAHSLHPHPDRQHR